MMFFTAEQVHASIKGLNKVHPFMGITFLACKKYGLPVDSAINFPLDAATNDFLKEYHRLSPQSDWFFQPFKSSDRNKKWVRPDYAAKGLQAINTQTFKDVFLHERNTAIWGWREDYVELLARRFSGNSKPPMLHLAIWLYKNEEFHTEITPRQLIEKFLSDFRITEKEKSLFNKIYPEEFDPLCFQQEHPRWDEYRNLGLPEAPDAAPEQGGTLSRLTIRGVGPASELEIEPGQRLTLITGDNGLGKSFLLDAAWWALTGTWAGLPIFPSGEHSAFFNPQISFTITSTTGIRGTHNTAFNSKKYEWSQPKKRQTITGLSVYARVDGSFAIWDPARHHDNFSAQNKSSISSEDAWNGSPGRIEGLIRDWVRWQSDHSSTVFQVFCQVLEKLSPPDLGILRPGEPVRIPGDLREIPTVCHAYGAVPITCASAGVKRVITLAYLIVWAWTEHQISASQKLESPQRTMVVLIDEMEAHLHPKWQRQFLPALLEISDILSKGFDIPSKNFLDIQFIAATHSPLVMASAETVFNSVTDRLFHLDIDNGYILLDEQHFVHYGDVTAWLESPVFELKHARSIEAEMALEAAKALQSSLSATEREVREVNNRLKKYLAADDRFWPRWVGFAVKFGVEV